MSAVLYSAQMKAALSEKDLLEEEVKSLQNDVDYYKVTVAQIQEKMERYKAKYSLKKRHSDDKLASSL